LIGGEESSGLTTKGHVTDKDGIWANLLIMDMLAYYGSRMENPLTSVLDIWRETVSLDGAWESFGGKENPESPERHSNSGRTDIDAILEVKEVLINYFLDCYGPNKANKLIDLDVIYAGGVRYDLAEIQLRDQQGNNRHFLRIRASGTEPINRVYVESSNIRTAKTLLDSVLARLERISIDHINNASSEWVLAETLAYFDPTENLVSATKNKLTSNSWSETNLAEKLHLMAESKILENRNSMKARKWANLLSE
jgi:phosphomannomutase